MPSSRTSVRPVCSVSRVCVCVRTVIECPPTDLEYGLPVQVRDSALNVKDDMPKSDVGREYFLQNMDQKVCVCVCVGVWCGGGGGVQLSCFSLHAH